MHRTSRDSVDLRGGRRPCLAGYRMEFMVARRTCRSPRYSRCGNRLHCFERLVEIRDDVVNMLDAY